MVTAPSKSVSFRSLYVYLVSLCALGMMVFGAVFLTQYLINKTVGPKYRLNSFEESQCQYMMAPLPTNDYTPSEAEITRALEDKARCEQNIESERAYRQISDLAAPLIVEVAGVILFVTHFVVLRKRWNA